MHKGVGIAPVIGRQNSPHERTFPTTPKPRQQNVQTLEIPRIQPNWYHKVAETWNWPGGHECVELQLLAVSEWRDVNKRQKGEQRVATLLR